MTRRRKIEALQRRADHLEERLASYRADGNTGRTEAELAAIRWALEILDAAARDGVLDRLDEIAKATR